MRGTYSPVLCRDPPTHSSATWYWNSGGAFFSKVEKASRCPYNEFIDQNTAALEEWFGSRQLIRDLPSFKGGKDVPLKFCEAFWNLMANKYGVKPLKWGLNATRSEVEDFASRLQWAWSYAREKAEEERYNEWSVEKLERRQIERRAARKRKADAEGATMVSFPSVPTQAQIDGWRTWEQEEVIAVYSDEDSDDDEPQTSIFSRGVSIGSKDSGMSSAMDIDNDDK